MTQLKLPALAGHLERTLAPLYVVHGDELLLALEAGDAIRAAAGRAGIEEREVFVVDAQFRWDTFLANNANLGLFGTRRLVDLRIPTGKPGAEGAKALETCAADPNPDNVTLVTLPKLDKVAQTSAWFTALSRAGIEITVWPLARDELPGWIAVRLARQGQTASPDTLAFLAEASEGNLLAARQEIEKLALLLPAGTLAHDAVVGAVADVARYDVAALSEAWLLGEAARTLRILDVMRNAGDSTVLPVWQLSEDVHALALVQELVAQRVAPAAAVRQARVWGRRAAALERAAQRIPRDVAHAFVPTLARLDALSKGLGRQDPWDELAAAALVLAGKPARPLVASQPA